MIRSIGSRKSYILNLLTIQTLFFTVPGTIVGFLVMILALSGLQLVIYQQTSFPIYTEINLRVYLTVSFANLIIQAIFMGLLMPFIANITPIRQAIQKELKDALDIYRKTVDDFTVKIKRLEKMGISPEQIIVGLSFAIFGFIVYYFIPLAALNGDLDLMFFILFMILFMMIVGMTIIGQILIPVLDRVILFLIMFFRP